MVRVSKQHTLVHYRTKEGRSKREREKGEGGRYIDGVCMSELMEVRERERKERETGRKSESRIEIGKRDMGQRGNVKGIVG